VKFSLPPILVRENQLAPTETLLATENPRAPKPHSAGCGLSAQTQRKAEPPPEHFRVSRCAGARASMARRAASKILFLLCLPISGFGFLPFTFRLLISVILISVFCLPAPGHAACVKPGSATTRTAKGTGSATATSITISSVTLNPGDTLLVGTHWHSTATTGVTWNGTALHHDIGPVTEGSGGTSYADIWSLYTAAGGTGNIVASTSASHGGAVVASAVSGLSSASAPAGALDKTVSASGSGTSISSGSTATTSQASEFLYGVIGGDDGSTLAPPGVWSNSFTNGQGAIGGGGNGEISEGYNTVSSTGTYAAAMTGTVSQNLAALIATYKTAPTAPILYNAGDTIYNNDFHVMQYCNGGSWVAMGLVPGTGPSGGTGTATRTAKGTAATSGGGGATSITISSVHLNAGDTLLAAVTTASGVTSVKWNSISLHEDVVVSSSEPNLTIWSLYTATGGTGSLVASQSAKDDMFMDASSVSGLVPSGALDQTAYAHGSGTTPSSGATPTTSQANEFLYAAMAYASGYSESGTWLNGFTYGGQMATDGSHDSVEEGFQSVTATGAYTAAKTGVTSDQWQAGLATYKIAMPCTNPVGNEGDMNYNLDNHVPQYCDGTNWRPMGPVPGAGGSGCAGAGGSPIRTALGKNTVHANTSVTLTNVTLSAGDLLIVGVAVTASGGGVTSVTWGGLTLNQDDYHYDGSGFLEGIYSAYISSGGTNTITVTIPNSGDIAFWASKWTGMASSSTLDQHVGTTGSGTSPSSGASGATTQAPEVLIGNVGIQTDSGGSGTWSNGFNNGQSATSSGTGGATNKAQVSEGYLTATSTGAYTAAKTGSTSANWAAAIATYKAAPPVGTGNEGDTIYNSTLHTLQYCDGTNWISAGGTATSTTNGLVGWWNLDEGSGTTAYDSSGKNNTGTLINGASWTTSGYINGAVSFDGVSNQDVQTTYTGALGDFTVCAWFKSSNDTAFSRIVDKSYSAGLWLGHDPGGAANKWGGGVREASSPYGIYVTLTTGSWHHICSVRSGTTHTIYGDGGAVSASNTVSSSAIDTSALVIGAANDGGGYLLGTIDDVRVYNRALSAAEVWSLYNGGP
jgi:Concanavalin A-like lectin/glucanases superfamily